MGVGSELTSEWLDGTAGHSGLKRAHKGIERTFMILAREFTAVAVGQRCRYTWCGGTAMAMDLRRRRTVDTEREREQERHWRVPHLVANIVEVVTSTGGHRRRRSTMARD